jgi:hypothetical protein
VSQGALYSAFNTRFREARGEAAWQLRDIRAKTASDSPNLKAAQALLGHETETTTAAVYRRAKGSIVSLLERTLRARRPRRCKSPPRIPGASTCRRVRGDNRYPVTNRIWSRRRI